MLGYPQPEDWDENAVLLGTQKSKIGCVSAIKTNRFALYCSQLALSLLQKSEVRLRLGNKNK